jgi:hypothetical protein
LGPKPTISYCNSASAGNGYEAALVNFRFIANELITTEQAVAKIEGKEAETVEGTAKEIKNR